MVRSYLLLLIFSILPLIAVAEDLINVSEDLYIPDGQYLVLSSGQFPATDLLNRFFQSRTTNISVRLQGNRYALDTDTSCGFYFGPQDENANAPEILRMRCAMEGTHIRPDYPIARKLYQVDGEEETQIGYELEEQLRVVVNLSLIDHSIREAFLAVQLPGDQNNRWEIISINSNRTETGSLSPCRRRE